MAFEFSTRPMRRRPALRRRIAAIVPLLAVSGWLLGAALPAAAFSQIGSEDGSERRKDGIVSVPLPPLPGAAEPQRSDVPAAPEAAPAAPSNPSPPAAASPGPSPAAPAASDPAATSQPDAGEGVPDTPGAGADESGASSVPATTPDASPEAAPLTDQSEDTGAGADGAAAPAGSMPTAVDASVPAARIYHGDEGLPPAVRDLRQKLIDIARAGDIEALRPYLQTGEEATVLTFGDSDGDPIAGLKAASGDGEGVEMLAILLEVLQAGHVRSEPDTDDEIFVWPYFTGVPIDKLTNPQKVELFELVTAGDYQEMLGFGAYNFYRVGISPDGKLQFFVAGD